MYIFTTLEFSTHNLDFHLLRTSVNANIIMKTKIVGFDFNINMIFTPFILSKNKYLFTNLSSFDILKKMPRKTYLNLKQSI